MEKCEYEKVLPETRPHGSESNYKQKTHQQDEENGRDDVHIQSDGRVREQVVAHGWLTSQCTLIEQCYNSFNVLWYHLVSTISSEP